tara:strand:- start:2148 stop:2462 length:315 start_codon:yes stop_codon:yes gene_type:complete
MNGIERIAAERQRQIEVEGWTPEHDDLHTEGELALAAGVYALMESGDDERCEALEFEHLYDFWPWSPEWLKLGEPIRNLEKAGALIAAEIDRRLRLEARQQEGE